MTLTPREGFMNLCVAWFYINLPMYSFLSCLMCHSMRIEVRSHFEKLATFFAGYARFQICVLP